MNKWYEYKLEFILQNEKEDTLGFGIQIDIPIQAQQTLSDSCERES